MTSITLSKTQANLNGRVVLPASKSISNRVLIINALSNSFEPIKNLSNCDDTKAIQQILFSNTNTFDVGNAGTAMRFLTAYLSKIVGEWTITGSERMQQRPIGVLVDALNSLGAQISYTDKEGYPPLKILGSNITGSEVTVPANTSSQFISALLLIAPTLANGLRIHLQDDVVSKSYILLTLRTMEDFGIQWQWKENTIIIDKQNYKVMPYAIEGDWSAASYWFATMAVANGGKLYLDGLKRYSSQGDSNMVTLFQQLGVKTQFSRRGMFIEKTQISGKQLNIDFTDMPDIAQTFAVCAALKNIPFRFTGLQTLKIKETDRITALINELQKLGYILTSPNNNELVWDGEMCEAQENIIIDTYNDHRMAMAFAPATMVFPEITINNPEVVTKSYPKFWDDFKLICT